MILQHALEIKHTSHHHWLLNIHRIHNETNYNKYISSSEISYAKVFQVYLDSRLIIIH